MKLAYEKNKSAYFHTPVPIEPKFTAEAMRVKIDKAQTWVLSKWKQVKKRLFNSSQRNELPTSPDFFVYTDTSGPGAIYNFFTFEPLGDPDGEPVSIEWTFSDGSSMNIPVEELSPSSFVSHVFPAAGTYTVKARVYDDLGEYSEASHIVEVTANQAPLPNFNITPQTGTIVDFEAAPNDPENAIVRYVWHFDDGSDPEESLVSNLTTHEFPSSGMYNVGLEVFDDKDVVGRISKKIYVDTTPSITDQPYPIVRLSTNYGAGPLTVNFDASLSVDTSNAALVKFEWDFGDFDSVSNYSKQSVAVHKYKAPGTYEGRLSVKDSNNNYNEYFFTVYVGASSIEPPHIVAQQYSDSREINFSSSPRAINSTLNPEKLFWNFGDGHTAQGPWPQHTYAINGSYTVRLVAHDIRGLRHSVLHKIVVTDQKDMPRARIETENDYQGINDEQVYNAGESEDPQQDEPLTYFWNFGDGSFASGSDKMEVPHQFTAKGHYPVKLFVTNSRGISEQGTVDVMVQDGAETRAQILYGPRMGVAPMTVQFDSGHSFSDGSTILSKVWQLHDDSYETISTFTRTFNEPGFYFEKLYMVDALGNESVDGRPVIVLDPGEIPPENEAPTAALKMEYAGPNAGNLAFHAWDSDDNDGYIEFYEWSLDGNPQVDGDSMFRSLNEGLHTVVLTVRDNWNSTGTLTKTFKVGASKEPDLEMAMTPSSPNKLESIEFDGSDSVVTAIGNDRLWWDFGDGNTARGAIVHHVYASSGTYTVKLSVTDLDGERHSTTEELIVSEP